MKSFLVLFILLALPLSASFSRPSGHTQKKSPAKETKPKADYGKYGFSFTTLDGKKISLADYAGKVVLVNLWAPWVEPCTKEAPGFVNLFKAYHSKGFEILSVAVRTSETDVRSFIAAHHLQWPVGIDDQVSANYKSYGLPDNYVFKPDGSVAKHFIGFTSEEALRHVLDELLPPSK